MRRIPWLSLVVVFVAACSGGDEGSGADGAAGASGGAGSKSACAEEPPPGAACVETVRAAVVDASGQTMPERFVTLCGNQLCFSATTDQTGVATFVVDGVVKPKTYAFYGHAGDGKGGVITQLETVGKSIVLTEPLRLPDVTRGAAELPQEGGGQPFMLGPVSFTVPKGVTFELDPIDAEDPEGRRPGATRVDPKLAPKALRDAGAKVTVALVPFAARASGGLPYTIPNAGTPGTKVRVVTLACDFLAEPFSAGTLEVVDEVTVAEDGSVSGTGLRTLSWVGVL